MASKIPLGSGSAPPGNAAAIVVIAVLALLAVALGYYGIRMLGRDAAPIGEQLDRLFEPRPGAPAPTPADPATAPVEAPPAATDDGGHARPAEPLAALEHTVGECLPALFGLSENVRLLAVDASPYNVDFVQESASVPNRFVRVSCQHNEAGVELAEAGRMRVPPMVGLADALPAQLVEREALSPAWFAARVAAARAAGARGAPERVEVSHVDGRGVLTRVTFDDGGRVQRIVLDAGDDPLDGAVTFPQVERLTEMTEAAAERGYRDLGQTLWSVGLAETVERMGRVYFRPEQGLRALEVGKFSVTLLLPDGRGAQRVTIDEYGDRSASETAQPLPQHCGKPFTLRDARRALDAAIEARGETLEAFEQREFTYASIACDAGSGTPRWRFEGG